MTTHPKDITTCTSDFCRRVAYVGSAYCDAHQLLKQTEPTSTPSLAAVTTATTIVAATPSNVFDNPQTAHDLIMRIAQALDTEKQETKDYYEPKLLKLEVEIALLLNDLDNAQYTEDYD